MHRIPPLPKLLGLLLATAALGSLTLPCAAQAAAVPASSAAPARDLRFVIFHSAGPAWIAGKSPFEQPGIADVVEKFSAGRQIKVRVKGGKTAEFTAAVRIDTPQEALYYANGGILQYVLRQLLAGKSQPQAVTA